MDVSAEDLAEVGRPGGDVDKVDVSAEDLGERSRRPASVPRLAIAAAGQRIWPRAAPSGRPRHTNWRRRHLRSAELDRVPSVVYTKRRRT